MRVLSCALLVAFALWVGLVDLRTRRIPNWLTIPALFLGVAAHGITAGQAGVVESLKGAGLALLILLPIVLLRGLGAGDWKLMGALGALLGFRMMLVVLWGAVLIAGLMLAYERRRDV